MDGYEIIGGNETENQAENGIVSDDKVQEDFSYKGYEVVRGVFFSHLFEPSVKLVRETVSVNAACIRKLPDTEYVQFLVNRDEKKLAVKPCTEDTKDSFRWSTVGKDGKKRPRTISCRPFFAKIMKLMDWDPAKRYRIMGKLIRTESIFVFDLKEPESFMGKEKASYPDEWNEGFGMPADKHDEEALVRFCENSSVFYLEKEENSNAGNEEGSNAIIQGEEEDGCAMK